MQLVWKAPIQKASQLSGPAVDWQLLLRQQQQDWDRIDQLLTAHLSAPSFQPEDQRQSTVSIISKHQ